MFAISEDTLLRTRLAELRDVGSLRVAVSDLNGCLRGKRVPLDAGETVTRGVRMPLSLSLLDIWGRDVASNPGYKAGDGDGVALPTGRGPWIMDWLDTPSALVPMWFFNDDGSACATDPRQVLARQVERAKGLGLTPVVGLELEFYLVAEGCVRPESPVSPVTGRRLLDDGIQALDELDGFEAFFDALDRGADAAGIGIEAAIAEGGAGQFEVTLGHHDDILRAADDAIWMKRMIRGIARSQGMAATFMAKPYSQAAGSGFHVHLSLRQADGRNIFNDGSPQGAPPLGHAVAGCLDSMERLALVFAPHLNSYRRVSPGGHAPSAVSWAYENRFAAIRIPGGPSKARRLEHRVAGADANPYLVLAAILGGVLNGIDASAPPPEPVAGKGQINDAPHLPGSWEQAIACFDGVDALGGALASGFAAAKRQELARFAARMTEFELESYLEVV